MKYFTSFNPYSQEQLATYEIADSTSIELCLSQAHTTFLQWKKLLVTERALKVLRLAELIQTHHERLARLATVEMGKTFAEAKLEVLKCITACEFYAKHTEQILAPQITEHIDGRKVKTVLEPLGTILGIFPWNFPYWQIIRSAVPVIMGGNTMIVKPAPNTPQCALALQELFNEAGLGNGIVQTLFVNENQITTIIADSRIAACTLTGSEKAGSAVASQAASHIKKSVMELGGSDPFIVLADADLDLVISNAVAARFQNNGQSCIASKRYIIHAAVLEQFTERLIREVSKLKMGDPILPDTNIGPLARKDLTEKLAYQVTQSIDAGAKILYQAKNPFPNSCFYPPTILSNIPKNSVAYKEELFGPVISVFSFVTDDEAIHLANDTEFGLGASIWTQDKERASTLAQNIEAGQVFINAVTRSNTAFAFGGVKKSGYGREMGAEGLKEFCFVKTIWFN